MSSYNLIVTLMVLTIALCEQSHNHTIYHIIPSYQDYQTKFKQKVGINNIKQMTYFGTGLQLCSKKQVCRFFTYLYEPKQTDKIKYNVLMTSGMHGNQLIGPTTLLYLYELLKPKNIRIIYFPVCNPSGYNLKQRYTYPNNIDLNRDFPIDDNTKCYEGSSTRIIDRIFRQYQIDLTINLHNGADQIGWNWGTKYHAKFPNTQSQPIYSTIGHMLKYIGGYNRRLNILPFQIGTMDQVIYPAEGTLDDWAYAGSWVESVPYQCNNYKYQPYPKDMHQGLVFLFELGEHNAPENKLGTSQGLKERSDSTSNSNGYVTRAIRMLQSLIKVIEPVIVAYKQKSDLLIKIQGCNKINKMVLQLWSEKDLNVKETFNSIQQLVSEQNSFAYTGRFTISNQDILQNSNLTLKYNIQCDREWNGVGKSFLATPRLYNDVIILYNGNNEQLMKINVRVIKLNGKILAIFFALLALVLILYTIYKNRRKNQIFQKIRKYEASDLDISNIESTSGLQQKNNQMQPIELSSRQQK